MGVDTSHHSKCPVRSPRQTATTHGNVWGMCGRTLVVALKCHDVTKDRGAFAAHKEVMTTDHMLTKFSDWL